MDGRDSDPAGLEGGDPTALGVDPAATGLKNCFQVSALQEIMSADILFLQKPLAPFGLLSVDTASPKAGTRLVLVLALWVAGPGEILGMDDRAGRREIGACSVILFPVLFDIDGYLKRYAGGLVVIRPRSLHIGPLAQAMIWVSASLFVGSREWNDERMITCPRGK